jgi:hydrogenase maturation protein HypF
MENTRIYITGIVQGVGFRPFVYNLAVKYGVKGWCLNDSEGVVIEVEGDPDAAFMDEIRNSPPPLSRIESIAIEKVAGNGGYSGFTIRESKSIEGRSVLVAPDVAVCDDCLGEMLEPSDRRYLYPFINCTNCGPRYSIVRDIPYDRLKTTMAPFKMCHQCESEYHDPSNRRFHAQPDACAVCGPKVWLHGKPEAGVNFEAISKTQKLLKEGAILAIKGLGGFHLACDAENTEAVAKLRERKRRSLKKGLQSNKPFALMAPDIQTVRAYCEITEEEEKALLERQRPIVLLEKKEGRQIISETVAPGNRRFGVMLPYTPLHRLLFHPEGVFKALVMTSGNISDEPIVIENEEALEKLSSIADFFLLHDRGIYMRVDDSILRIDGKAKRFIRRARGFVPDVISLNEEMEEVFAAGGLLKNTFCITKGRNAIVSQHMGDLENFEAMEFYKETFRNLRNTFRAEPKIVAHDLHPDYLSTAFALDYARERAIPASRVIAVQHHHAHIAGAMAENNLHGDVIGVSFDGTGFGTDGNIWGGEFLTTNRQQFKRAAHLKYARLPGGDMAAKEPWRMAISYLMDSGGVDSVKGFRQRIGSKAAVVEEMIHKGINSPYTSSMGRLFDAVASIIGLRDEITFEAEAAIELESVADNNDTGGYPFSMSGSEPMEIDAAPLIRAVVQDVNKGASIETIAGRFHNAIADMTLTVCTKLRDSSGINDIVLTGGVFQNSLLTKLATGKLEKAGFKVYMQEKVPSNDGGISLGQAVVAWERVKGDR